MEGRRKFLEKTILGSVGVGLYSIIPTKVWSAPISPSDQINVALIGCNGHGFSILRHHLNSPGVNCVAICDVDENVLKRRIKEVQDNYGQNPTPFRDFRQVLERKDIDAVIIGTPDHWHCLIMVEACSAGKDVYVEKPLANTIGECKIMVEASDYYKRVVQVGQQQRSGFAFQEPIRQIRTGNIGKVRKVSIWGNFNYGTGSKPAEDSMPPTGVDYDFWLGPAPLRTFNPNRFHGSWRHFWNYGGGLMSDWGVHLLDMGIWAMEKPKAPGKVLTFANNLSTEVKQRETFDTMMVTYANEEFPITWDMVAGTQLGPYGKPYGVAFIGEKGTIVADRKSFQIFPEWNDELKALKTEAVQFNEGKESHDLHVKNFLECIKTRETTICPPETGRIAALYAHIPNIAGRVGESVLEWDDSKQIFTNSTEANEYITPSYRSPWKLPSF
jgi:predicted dehydrogenase